jgi:hypothetical protein
VVLKCNARRQRVRGHTLPYLASFSSWLCSEVDSKPIHKGALLYSLGGLDYGYENEWLGWTSRHEFTWCTSGFGLQLMAKKTLFWLWHTVPVISSVQFYFVIFAICQIWRELNFIIRDEQINKLAVKRIIALQSDRGQIAFSVIFSRFDNGRPFLHKLHKFIITCITTIIWYSSLLHSNCFYYSHMATRILFPNMNANFNTITKKFLK